MHQLCWLGIKQVIYLACSKFTALIKLVSHANIVCSLVAFLASHLYHTFQSISNLQFLGLAFFPSKDVFLNGISTLFFKAGLYGTCLSDQVVQILDKWNSTQSSETPARAMKNWRATFCILKSFVYLYVILAGVYLGGFQGFRKPLASNRNN